MGQHSIILYIAEFVKKCTSTGANVKIMAVNLAACLLVPLTCRLVEEKKWFFMVVWYCRGGI
jgi:hypothetical protein